MARPLMRWLISLNPLVCYDEGDGIGDAEPYLWTIFFKCDGATLRVTDAGVIDGYPIVITTPGSHGNLNTYDVNAGDTVAIPPDIGLFGSYVLPIPVAPSLQPLLGEDIPGFFGVVAVLMEEDNVTDAGAEAGHQALNDAVEAAIIRVLQSLGPMHTQITQADIDSVTKGLHDTVSAAIQVEQSFFQNLWSWLNADDEIGDQTFVFNQDQFSPPDHMENDQAGTLAISKRWRNEGDWEIRGAMALMDACPANAVASILAGGGSADAYRGGSSQKFGEHLAAMRSFRDTYLPKFPGLGDWWDLAVRNSPQIAYLMMRDAQVRETVGELFTGAAGVLKNLNAPLPQEFLDCARKAAGLARKSGFRRLAQDASQAEAALQKLKPRSTGQDAMNMLAELAPGRYPKRGKQPRPTSAGRS